MNLWFIHQQKEKKKIFYYFYLSIITKNATMNWCTVEPFSVNIAGTEGTILI